MQAIVPSLNRNGASMSAQSKYDASFSVIGPMLWNAIPAETTLKPTLGSFKSSLQKFLDDTPDEPPTRGYTIGDDNSILHKHVGGLQRTARWPR